MNNEFLSPYFNILRGENKIRLEISPGHLSWVSEIVDEEVHLCGLGVHTLVNERNEEFGCLLISLIQGECIAKIIDIFIAFQLRNSCRKHLHSQVPMRILPEERTKESERFNSTYHGE